MIKKPTESNEIKGPDKAALFLLSIGEDRASEVMKHLKDDEVRTIASRMLRLKPSHFSKVLEVYEEFSKMCEVTEGVPAGEEYVVNLIRNAFGPRKAEEIINRIFKKDKNSKNPIDFIRKLDPNTLSTFIRGEHPQTMAAIIATLEPQRAVEVIKKLPEELRKEVIVRIVNMEAIADEMVEEVAEVIESQIENFVESGTHTKRGGIELGVEILNLMERSVVDPILNGISEENPDLAEKIKERMFVFEDLLKIDDRGIQMILREVSSETLALALKTASDELKEKIFKNMSKRAAETLMEDIETMGPKRISEIEAAQKEITQIARRLEEEGKITIGGGAEELV